MTILPRPTILLLPIVLAGCGREAGQVDMPDNSDPVAAVALSRPIMTDARLDAESNQTSLRPAAGAIQAMLPPGTPAITRAPLRDHAKRLSASAAASLRDCRWSVGYSYGWAARLPVEARLPADGRTLESAGSDSDKCRLRLVAFSSNAAAGAVIADYRRQATAAGYTVANPSPPIGTGLVATRPRDNAVLIVAVEARDAGSIVDLITNRGL